jgi:hypothetical protein
MDKDGNVLVEHEGDRSVDGFEETGKKAAKHLELKAKAEKGDKAAKIELVLGDLEAGRMKPDEAKKMLEGVELTADQKKQYEAALANSEINDILNGFHPTSQAEADKAREEIAQKFLERKKAGKPAPTGERECQTYWVLLMGHAEKTKDVKLYEEGLNALKAKFGQNPQAKQPLAKMQKTLDAMKKGGDDKKDDKKDNKEDE